jgi:hypothetical protein
VDFEAGSTSDSLFQHSQKLDGLLASVRGIPGVAGVGLGRNVPLRRSAATSMEVAGLGRVVPLNTGGPYVDALDPNAMAALGIVVKRGRALDSTDRLGTMPVIVVNETFARHAFGGADPLAACVKIAGEAQCRSVVGVIQDVRRENILEPPTLQAIVPLAQAPAVLAPKVIFLKTRGDPATLRPIIRATLERAGISPSSYEFDAFTALVDPELASWRTASNVFVLYSVLALLVAGSSVVSVLELVAARRRREFAIRRALGASPGNVFVDVTSRLRAWVLVGATSGVVVWLVTWWRVEMLIAPISLKTVAICGVFAIAVITATALAVAISVTREITATSLGSIVRV